jgi:large subunit ribosomal protein L4
MNVDTYTTEGKKKGSTIVADVVFDTKQNSQLMHQVVTVMMSNARSSIAHTKDRSDVRGGGKKPWKQKGTGNARHGSRRSPIWRGGGITFGPTNEKNYTKKINKKMRTKALYVALSDKHRNGQILFVDKMAFETPKTAQAKVIIDTFSRLNGYSSLKAKYNAAVVYVSQKDNNLKRSFANLGNIEVKEARSANPVDILGKKVVIIVDPEAISAIFESRSNNVSDTIPLKKKNTKKALKSPVIKSARKTEKDDLTKIEGIGPKIAEALRNNKIITFAQLAEAKKSEVQEMIKDIKGNHQADTWGKQAMLARDDKWDELKKWQDELDGGVVK